MNVPFYLKMYESLLHAIGTILFKTVPLEHFNHRNSAKNLIKYKSVYSYEPRD